MDIMTSAVGTIKSEPETIPEEECLTSHCDEVLQYGIVKQETTEDLANKCVPWTPAAEEHAHKCCSYSEIDIDYPDIKKECFVHLERIDQSRDKTEGSPKIKKNVKDSFTDLPEAKLELVQLQKESLRIGIAHKKRMIHLEIEENIKESEHKDEMRRRELLLLDLKIKQLSE